MHSALIGCIIATFVILEIICIILKKKTDWLDEFSEGFVMFIILNLIVMCLAIPLGFLVAICVEHPKFALITFGIIAGIVLFKYLIYRIFWGKKR